MTFISQYSSNFLFKFYVNLSTFIYIHYFECFNIVRNIHFHGLFYLIVYQINRTLADHEFEKTVFITREVRTLERLYSCARLSDF